MEVKNKIDLYGFGVVGQGFYDYLLNNNETQRIPRIFVKDSAKVRKKIKTQFSTNNSNSFLENNTIVELINSDKEAFGIVDEALKNGKNVVSANKKMIANNLSELIDKEQASTSKFLYEGAVCGSIPIIRILNDLYANESIQEIKGIFNGSSNYILSKVFNEDISYQEALIEAQKLGFAEVDPTSDVRGFDSLYKLIIITAHAFGKIVNPYEVLNIGIEFISKEDIEFAKQFNLKIKLIAKATLKNERLSLSVFPTLIDSKSELFEVENEYNGVLINSENIGEQFYKGRGAGSLPTGAVVYSDLKALDDNYNYSYKKLNKKNINVSTDIKTNFLLSFNGKTNIEELDVNREDLFALDEIGRRFILEISIEELIQKRYNFEKLKVSIIALGSEELSWLLKSRFQLEGIGLNI